MAGRTGCAVGRQKCHIGRLGHGRYSAALALSVFAVLAFAGWGVSWESPVGPGGQGETLRSRVMVSALCRATPACGASALAYELVRQCTVLWVLAAWLSHYLQRIA